MTRLLAVVLAELLLASGCSKDSGGSSSGPSPETTLATAKKNLDDTSGVQIGLETAKLPAGVNGLVKASGVGTHEEVLVRDLDAETMPSRVDQGPYGLDAALHDRGRRDAFERELETPA